MTTSYISGHHASVLTSHKWRTAANSAAYLLPHLDALCTHITSTRPDSPPTLLDIGCGPGTITLDFARLVAPHNGTVVGIDPSESVVADATQLAEREGVDNVRFVCADAFNLPAELGSFDVVHAHQVLQHVPDAVALLRVMKSIARPGGLVATRETGTSSWSWYPLLPGLDEWRELWVATALKGGTQPDMGRRLLSAALGAGWKKEDVSSTTGSWCFADEEAVEWWSKLWADRCLESDFPKRVVKFGLGSEEDMQRLSKAWREWGSKEDAWFGMLHAEIVCRC